MAGDGHVGARDQSHLQASLGTGPLLSSLTGRMRPLVRSGLRASVSCWLLAAGLPHSSPLGLSIGQLMSWQLV